MRDDDQIISDENSVIVPENSAIEPIDVSYRLAQAQIEPLVDEDDDGSAILPETLTPDVNNVVTLPENISLADFAFEIDGDDLLMVSADGSTIRIVGGAASVPTFQIGELELPQELVVLALGESEINIAAGAAVPAAPTGSGGDLTGVEAGLNEVNGGNALLGNTTIVADTPVADTVVEGIAVDDTDEAVTTTVTDTAVEGTDQATDSDGDSATSNLTDIVNESVPVQGDDGTATVLGEDGLDGANLSGGSFEASDQATVSDVSLGIEWGADDGAARSVAFSNWSGTLATTSSSDASDFGLSISDGSFTSGGVALVYAVSTTDAGFQVLTAYAGSDADGNEVFRITLDPTSDNGSYTFELLGALDHDAGSDSLTISFSYAATDADGDQGSVGTASVTVQDDMLIFGGGATRSVDEDGLTGGNAGDSYEGNWGNGGYSDFDAGGGNDSRTSVTQSLNINWGADNGAARSVVFSDTDVAVYSDTTLVENLTSRGEAVSFRYGTDTNGDTNYSILEGYVAGSDPSLDRIVFTVSLSDETSGSYTFELVDVLDHIAPYNAEDNLRLIFNVTATDSDGDSADSSFSVIVDDDAPVIGTDVTTALDDSTLVTTTAPVTVLATGQLNFSGGADGATVAWSDTTSFTTTSGLAAGATALTTAAPEISFTVDDDGVLSVFQDQTDGSPTLIFTVYVNTATGAYTVTQYNNLLHAVGSDEQSFSFSYVVTDGDGDTATGTLDFTLTDDAPVQGDAGTATVLGEDGLDGANLSGGSFDASDVKTTGALSLGIKWGADDGAARSVAFSNRSGTLATTSSSDASDFGLSISNGSLSSDGVALVYAVSTTDAGFQVLTAYAGSVASGNEVFKITLDPTSDNGSYTFELLGALDHHAGSDSLEISFSYAATDADGDQGSVGTASVKVEDGVPSVKVDLIYDNTSLRLLGTDETSGQQRNDESTAVNDSVYTGSALETYAIDQNLGDYISIAIDGLVDVDGSISAGADSIDTQTISLTNKTGAEFVGIYSSVSDSGTGEKVYLYTEKIGSGEVVVGRVGSSTGADPAGDVAFTLSIDADGNVMIAQYRAIAHNDSLSANDAQYLANIHVTITATDGDGDSVTNTSTAQLNIGIFDDGPTIGTTETVTVTEESLVGTNSSDELEPQTVSATGSLAISWGADNGAARSVMFSGTQTGLSGLTSYGETVTVAQLADGTLVGYTGTTVPDATSDSQVVFYASLDATTTSTSNGDGSYSFTLVQPLDHSAPANNAQELDLTFSYVATDSDGDSAISSFIVTVDAAGTVDSTSSSINYSNLSTGVIVNLSSYKRTYFNETVAGDTATDRAGYGVIGTDSMADIKIATGGSGDDILLGGGEKNELYGGAGDDYIRAGNGDDLVGGGEGNDTIYGGTGDDSLYGVSGDDVLDGGAGDDIISGGLGTDTASYASASSWVKVDLSQSGVSQDTVGAGSDKLVSIENLTGSNYDDTLAGNGGDNVITGLDGDDEIYGGAGNDTLDGGAGDDSIAGGAGQDILTGGDGADIFVFSDEVTVSEQNSKDDEDDGTGRTVNVSDIDTITDYNLSEGDEIDLSALLEAAFGNSVSEADVTRSVSLSSDGNGNTDLVFSLRGGDDNEIVSNATVYELTGTISTVRILYSGTETVEI